MLAPMVGDKDDVQPRGEGRDGGASAAGLEEEIHAPPLPPGRERVACWRKRSRQRRLVMGRRRRWWVEGSEALIPRLRKEGRHRNRTMDRGPWVLVRG